MKRSIIAIIISVFFGVSGLIVLQHSEYAPIMAANNSAENNVIYTINCPSTHKYITPSEVNFDVNATHNPSTGLLTPYLHSVTLYDPISDDVGFTYTVNADPPTGQASLHDTITTANVPIEFVHPIMVSSAMCFGGSVSLVELRAQARASFPAMKTTPTETYTIAYDSGTPISSSEIDSVLSPATLDSDDRTAQYGRTRVNSLSASIEVNLGITAPSYQQVVVDWYSVIAIP